MCGIAGIYLKNKRAAGVSQEGIERFCDKLLLEIEDRGRHAAGFVAVNWDGKVILDKIDKPASEFIKERDRFPENTQAVLLHTRFWTKGKPDVMGNNHPVLYNTCFTVHNGGIDNDDELFKQEELKRNFEVDSEIIPAILDKYGMDTPGAIKTALEKLEGYLAIAAIDPIRFPGRLLLAKGDSSPLHIFENKNVIVWASSSKAIREAWGDVVGTPPKQDKIKWVSEGKFYVADNYSELVEHSFTPKRRHNYSRHAQSQGGFRRVGVVNTPARQIQKPWDSKGPFNTVDDFLAAVNAYRDDPENAESLVRRWDLVDSYDLREFADVEGARQWHQCICNHLILREDMQAHLKYGSICKDCYWVIFEEWKKQGEQEEAEINLPEIPEIPAVDKKNLESWAQYESEVHRYTLADLSDVSGLTPAALDFLLHRTMGRAHEYGNGMNTLKFKLQQAYNALQEQVHIHMGAEIQRRINTRNNVGVEAAQEIADQQQYPWEAYSVLTGTDRFVRYLCKLHDERFDYGDHCAGCLLNDTDDSSYIGECGEYNDEVCGVEIVAREDEGFDIAKAVTDCPTCGLKIIGTCIVCESRNKTVVNETPIMEVTETACCCKTTRDRKCRRKLALVVQNSLIGKQKGYCAQHWNKCAVGKCGKDANFTALDGQRYCHSDARGRQGISDAAARRDGNANVIMEVK